MYKFSILIFLKRLLLFAYLGVLAAVAWTDWKTRVIYDRFHIEIFLLGLAAVWLYPETGICMRLAGIFAVSLPMLFLATVIPGAFGGGDIKLMAVSGFLLGWRRVICAMAVAVLAGGSYGLYLLAVRHSSVKEGFALGPFLAFGLTIAVFFGDGIADWYLSAL